MIHMRDLEKEQTRLGHLYYNFNVENIHYKNHNLTQNKEGCPHPESAGNKYNISFIIQDNVIYV